MKTQISKPAARSPRYSEEYRQQAVARWKSSGRSAAEIGEELGIRPALICRWAKAQRDRRTVQAARPARSLEEIEAENARLRAENAQLLEQREILKKSLGILSETPRRCMPESKP